MRLMFLIGQFFEHEMKLIKDKFKSSHQIIPVQDPTQMYGRSEFDYVLSRQESIPQDILCEVILRKHGFPHTVKEIKCDQ